MTTTTSRPAGELPSNALSTPDLSRQLVLSNNATAVGSVSYEIFFRAFIQQNLVMPHLVTPTRVDEMYHAWLIESCGIEGDKVDTLYAERSSALAFRLWCDNECRKAGYATRYSDKLPGYCQWATAGGLGARESMTNRRLSYNTRLKTTSRSSRILESTNYLYDSLSKKVLARASTIIDGCYDFDELNNPLTGKPITQWDHDMVMVPHCVRYRQPSPPYEEFCRATQVVNPLRTISEHLMIKVWTAVFDCKVELGKITREAADRAIAKASSPYAKLYWTAAAKIDVRSPPGLQQRPTVSEYDSLFNFISPTYPANRLLTIDQVGKGLIIPLSQPTWCLHPEGQEFVSFTTYIEWLNEGITREQVVKAWLSLDWSASGRRLWARQRTVDEFASKHWDPAIVELDKKALEQEQELRSKLAEMSRTPGPTVLRTSQLQPLPIERPKTGWQPSQGPRQPHLLHTPTPPRASTRRRSSAPGPTTRSQESLFTRLQDPSSTLRARGESAPRRGPPVGQRLSLTKPA